MCCMQCCATKVRRKGTSDTRDMHWELRKPCPVVQQAAARTPACMLAVSLPPSSWHPIDCLKLTPGSGKVSLCGFYVIMMWSCHSSFFIFKLESKNLPSGTLHMQMSENKGIRRCNRNNPWIQSEQNRRLSHRRSQVDGQQVPNTWKCCTAVFRAETGGFYNRAPRTCRVCSFSFCSIGQLDKIMISRESTGGKPI